MATKAIPVTSGDIPSTQSNVVVFIKPSVMTGWTSLSSGEANSLRIYSDSGLSTELARHVITSDLIAILVPSLSSSTILYADYDGTSPDYSDSDTYGRNAVWAHDEIAYILGDTTDVTGNGNTLSATGSPTATTGPYGISNTAYDYSGTGQYHTTSGNIIPYTDTTDWTISAFVNPDVTTRGDFFCIYPELEIRFGRTGAVYEMGSLYTPTNALATGATTRSANNWYYVVGTLDYSARATEIFVNGVSDGTSTGSGSRAASDNPLSIGTEYAGAAYNTFNGQISLARVRNEVIPDDKIAIEYNNLDVANFWGTVTDSGGASAPTVTTQSVSSIGTTTATGNGNVTSDGGATITERGVCWNTGGTPTTSDSTATSAGTTGAFTASMTSLSPSTTYYVRAYAINSEGTSYGSEVDFTTSASSSAPTVTTSPAFNIQRTVASVPGNVTSDGGATVTERGIAYATTTSPTTGDSTEVVSGTTGAFRGDLTGLTAGTTYYARAYATNSEGTSYGSQISFTTLTDPETYNRLKVYDGSDWVVTS